MIRFIKLSFCLLIFSHTFAQENWDLRRCVDYALQNNISVKQADLQVRFAELDFQQSRVSQFPFLTFGGNLGYSSGRNQNPTNFSLITTGYLSNSYSLQASIDLFNWFTKKNSIAAKDYTFQATQAGAQKARDDIALNVAVGYLQVLLAKEQATLAAIQVNQTKSQLENTRKQVDAGAIPELNAAQVESQLSTDSSNLITAQTSAQELLLQLKALLNLDAAVAFDIASVPVDLVPVESLGELQPESVYNLAMANLPQQKVDELNLKAALKSVESARGNMYPTISMFGSLGTTFNDKANEVKSKSQINAPIGTVTVGMTPYQVYPLNPFDVYTYGKIGYFNQLNQNFRQSIGLSLNIPILNGGSLRSGWQRSKLSLRQTELQKEQNSRTLKQDIFKAYNDALAAFQKFNANKKAVETAQKVYDFAKKRYDLNLLSTYDLLISQNNLLTAKSQSLYSHYDYVFKMKLLEFYKGQGLKL
ncbi:MAG: TolC family protein [Bacteroidetes bacterium]|nr:TolC family protein [Bacteroidota bacterium]MBS1631458.1 TolC family protein [Bacteroidota bacterium]